MLCVQWGTKAFKRDQRLFWLTFICFCYIDSVHHMVLSVFISSCFSCIMHVLTNIIARYIFFAIFRWPDSRYLSLIGNLVNIDSYTLLKIHAVWSPWKFQCTRTPQAPNLDSGLETDPQWPQTLNADINVKVRPHQYSDIPRENTSRYS